MIKKKQKNKNVQTFICCSNQQTVLDQRHLVLWYRSGLRQGSVLGPVTRWLENPFGMENGVTHLVDHKTPAGLAVEQSMRETE